MEWVVKISWSAPMTAVAGATFTAAQFNQYVRDNLNMTAPALASAASQIFVSTAANVVAARTPTAALVATSQTTTSTSFTDLTTVGPAVTVTTGTAAIVAVYCANTNSGSTSSLMSYAVSGSSSIAAADSFSQGGAFGTAGGRTGATYIHTGLTAGSNTFTAKYRVGSGTGTFVDRRLAVIPL